MRFVGIQYDVSTYQDRLRLSARERGAREAAEFLAEASPLLDASLDLRSTLDSLARLSVPFLADVCVVNEIRFDEVHRLAAAAVDPETHALVRALPAQYRVRHDEPLARVLETGQAEIIAGAGAPVFGPRGGQLRGDAMLVPLKARGRVIGAVLFVSVSERRYGSEDLLLAEDLARRAALALDNARLYENIGSIARTLQEGLLPDRLPALAGLEFAARFRPAGDGSVIGGDFYDVLPRPDGVDLVIGDVTGKGARAAALTGLVRHTVRTAARYEATPSGVLDVVNRTLVAERGESGRYCTVAFCRLDFNGHARATLCCAGHPMPMVMRAGGTVERVGRPGSVLGWVEDPKLLDVEFELDGGESLVLYTDGVTEARTTGDAYGRACARPLREDASPRAAARPADGRGRRSRRRRGGRTGAAGRARVRRPRRVVARAALGLSGVRP